MIITRWNYSATVHSELFHQQYTNREKFNRKFKNSGYKSIGESKDSLLAAHVFK